MARHGRTPVPGTAVTPNQKAGAVGTLNRKEVTSLGRSPKAASKNLPPVSTCGRLLSWNGCYVRSLCKAALQRPVVRRRGAAVGPGQGGRPARNNPQQAPTSFRKLQKGETRPGALLNLPEACCTLWPAPAVPRGQQTATSFRNLQLPAPSGPPASGRAPRPIFAGICQFLPISAWIGMNSFPLYRHPGCCPVTTSTRTYTTPGDSTPPRDSGAHNLCRFRWVDTRLGRRS